MIARDLLFVVACAAFALAGGGPQDAELPDFWRVIERAAQREGAAEELSVVLEHMQGIDARRAKVAGRLRRVQRGLAEPWTPPALAAELRGMLAGPVEEHASFATLAGGIADWLDEDDFERPGADASHVGLRRLDELWSIVIEPERKGLALLEALSAYVGHAHDLLEESLSGLEAEQREILFEGYPAFYETYYRRFFPKAEITDEQKRDYVRYVPLLVQPPVDRALLLGVADGLLRFSDPKFLKTLKRRLVRVEAQEGADAFGPDVLAVVGAEARNRVLLAGRKASAHSARAALTIDLGGDDVYTDAAVVDDPGMLVCVVIDLSGDDTYNSDGAGPVFAVGGAALLIDREGEDHYSSQRLGQAASVLGFAALLDLAGDDAYTAQDYCQGHTLCGVALLYDVRGDDTYDAWAFAQGGGVGNGLCALVDADGDDTYVADLHWPDVYGDSGPDVYHGASQGYCTGLRPGVAGGIAALLDLGSGSDRYQAGSFSQGGGYFFSFGLMYDGGGDDQNYGSRYAQGFGVHQAIGVRWDAAGDDAYTCRSVAHAGMAWDEGVGYLLEDGGDDTYHTGDLSCGGAAQTGIAICIDRGGKDRYVTGKQSQGGTGSSEYHDKPALGVLIDLGAGDDEYSLEDRSEGVLRATRGVELFFDATARDMRRTLNSRHLR